MVKDFGDVRVLRGGSVLIAIVLFTGADIAEIIASGIRSVPDKAHRRRL